MDFVIRRKGLTFGYMRQELRPWVGEHSPKSVMLPKNWTIFDPYLR